MPFRVVQPPSDEAELAEVGKRLFAGADKLGIKLDAEGFLFSWVNGTRVVIQETDDEIVGFALLTLGKRWTHNDVTSTVLRMEAHDFDGMIEFLKQISAAMGCYEMFIQTNLVTRVGDENHYKIIGHLLG